MQLDDCFFLLNALINSHNSFQYSSILNPPFVLLFPRTLLLSLCECLLQLLLWRIRTATRICCRHQGLLRNLSNTTSGHFLDLQVLQQRVLAQQINRIDRRERILLIAITKPVKVPLRYHLHHHNVSPPRDRPCNSNRLISIFRLIRCFRFSPKRNRKSKRTITLILRSSYLRYEQCRSSCDKRVEIDR